MSESKKIYKANKETQLSNYAQGLNRFYSSIYQNKVDKQLRDEQAKDTYKANMQIRSIREDAKLEAFEQSERNFVDQLIFNQQAEKEALEGEEKVFNERILANAFETDETNLAYQRQIIDSKYQYDTAQRGIKDAVRGFQTSKALLSLGAEQETLQAENRQKSLKLREQQAKAESNTQQYKNRLQALQDEGASRSRGRAGRTAQRSLQSIQALAGVNSALIADQLTKSQQAIDIDREIVDAQLGAKGFIERGRRLRTRQARQQKRSTVRGLKAQQDQVAKSLGISTEQFNMSREQLGRSLLSAADSYEKRVAAIQRQKFGADMAAYAQRQLSPSIQPEIPKPFETKLPLAIKPPRPVKPVWAKNQSQMTQDTNPVLQGISGVAGVVSTVGMVSGNPVVAGVAAGVGFAANLADRYLF